MNIMHLRSSRGFYGAESIILSLCKNIDKKEFNCFLVCFKDLRFSKVVLVDEAKKVNIPTEVINLLFRFDLLSAVIKLRKLLNKYNIQILHCHDYKANIIGLLTAKTSKIKLVTTLHGWTQAEAKLKFYEYLDSLTIRYFEKIIAVSHQIEKDLLKLGFARGKIDVVHNAIDMSRFIRKQEDIDYKKKLGIDKNCKVIGSVGRLSSEKGHRYLIEAVQEIVKVFPDVVFLIVGEGSDEKLLENMVSREGLQKHVIFYGFVAPQEMRKIYSVMDLFILPSLTEGISLVLLEAMAMGIPTVATNVGGTPEIIKHNEKGYLIPPGDSNAITKAVKELLLDDAKLRLLAKAGQNFVKREFTVDKMVRKTEKIYKELVNK